jgi:hypothetical protein
MKTYEEWRYSSSILDLGTRSRCMVKFMPLPLYPRGTRPRYPLNRRLGALCRAGLDAMEKKKSCSYWESDPNHPTRIESLYRLSYPGSVDIIENPPKKCSRILKAINKIKCTQGWKHYSKLYIHGYKVKES